MGHPMPGKSPDVETSPPTGHPSTRRKPAPKKTAPKKPAAKTAPVKKPSAKPPTTSNKSIDKALLAQRFGWTLAALQGIPEVWDKFNEAVKNGWSEEQFGAQIRATKWYQQHSDQFRQMYVLEKSDPAKWKRVQSETFSKVHDLASSMGVKYDPELFGKITRQALYQGWSESQIRNALGGLVNFASGSHFGGSSGQAEVTLRQYAYNMGIKLSDGTLKTWLQQLARGDKTIEDFQAYMQSMAESAFPSLASQIKSGITVRQLADPYIQSMASILEINPNAIDLNDSTIRRALSSVSQDGKTSTGVPLWQFEYDLKKDPRWLKTNNARESINSVAHDVLKQWGFAF